MNGCQLLSNQSWAADTEAVYGGYSSRVRHGFLQVFIMRIDIGVSSAHPVFRTLLCQCSFSCICYMLLSLSAMRRFFTRPLCVGFLCGHCSSETGTTREIFWGLFVIHVARDTFFRMRTWVNVCTNNGRLLNTSKICFTMSLKRGTPLMRDTRVVS